MKDIKSTEQEINGIKVRFFNIFMIVLSCLFIIFLFFAMLKVADKYEALVTHTQDHIITEKQAVQVYQASDYLTMQTIYYVETGKLQYADNYFYEANVTKRREKALEELRKFHSEEILENILAEAIQSSNELMVQEIYAMKLMSEAKGYEPDMLPKEIRNLQLEPEDAALSADEKIDKANVLVYGDTYQEKKDEIYGYLDDYTNGLLEIADEEHNESITDFNAAFYLENTLLIGLLIINFIVYIVIIMLVIKPLRLWKVSLEKEEKLEVIGAYEFKYLASVYNRIYKQKEKHANNEVLMKQQLELDPLTGIKNRMLFDSMEMLMGDEDEPFALLLIDVDHFKEINDTYGHATGDLVLKRIARLLTETFRAQDHVFRIGGDEFAAIINGIPKERAAVIAKKIDVINQKLKTPDDDLPIVSLSVGAAFSAAGFHSELYSEADKALYEVKRNGRCGCQIYMDQ